MNGSLKIGKVYGINILLHFSWFFIFALLAWSLAESTFPSELPGKSLLVYWIMGTLASGLLFLSVLLHELSHSLVAIRNKIAVHKITLFFFGGVAEVKDDKFTPKIELLVACAGPLMSISLAVISFAIARYSSSLYIHSIFSYVASVNFMLGIFNLAPGFPLDGGRIFRAILWWKWKNLERATYVASKTGKGFAVFMIIFGVAEMAFGGFGLWYIFLGLFLYSIAGSAYEQAVLKGVLESVKAKEAMTKRYKALSAKMDAKEFDYKKMLGYGQSIFPVMQGRKIIGLTSARFIEKAKASAGKVLISSVTVPMPKVKTIAPADNCMKAYEIMAEQNIDLVPVIEKNRLVGVIKAATLVELLKMSAAKQEVSKGKPRAF